MAEHTRGWRRYDVAADREVIAAWEIEMNRQRRADRATSSRRHRNRRRSLPSWTGESRA